MQLPDLLLHILRPLNATGISYMVTGGVAAIIYGEPRLTNDVDIVATIDGTGARAVVNTFRAPEFYCPPLETLQEEAGRASGGHFNLLHAESALRADIYLAGEGKLASWGLARRHLVEFGPDSVPVAPIEYVILMKLQWLRQAGSERHRSDIASMVRLSGELVDREALQRWITELGVEAEWKASNPLGQ